MRRLAIITILLLVLAAVVSSTTYYIVDAKHGRSIVAGDNYDGHIYHQDPRDRPNAKWLLIPVHGQPGYYFIRDIQNIGDTLSQETGMMDAYIIKKLTIAQMPSGD